MMDSKAIGRYGEQLVHGLLPGSVWCNPFEESKCGYDLLWEGIKIEVKTRSRPSYSSKSAYEFSVIGKREDCVFIGVGLSDPKNPIFWVRRCGDTPNSYYAKLSDSVPVDNLAKVIKSVAHTV